MKTLKFMNYSKLFVLTTILFFALASCKKDDSDEPVEYVGEWITYKTISGDGIDVKIKDVIKFKETSFSEIASMKNPDSGSWVDILGRKGEFETDGEEMDVTITSVGFTTEDEDGLPTGTIDYYQEGTEEFYDLLQSLEMSQNYKAEYTIKDDKLTLKADNNNNGNFDDEDEVYVYTRK